MNKIHVRPGLHSFFCRCFLYFGSGFGSCKLITTGALVGDPFESRDNGFLSWKSRRVLLTPGNTAQVLESYYPGGNKDTLYVADMELWRNERREHLTRLFANRAWLALRERTKAYRLLRIEQEIESAQSKGREYLAACWLTQYYCVSHNVNEHTEPTASLRWEANGPMGLQHTPKKYWHILPMAYRAIARRRRELDCVRAAKALSH